MDTSTGNRALYQRFCDEVLVRGNLAEVDVLVDEAVVSHSPFPGQPPGREGFKQALAQFRAAFPELTVQVKDLIAAGDKVVGYFAVSGVQRGEFMGVAAGGQRVGYDEMVIVRFANGKIIEHWSVADTFEMMRSLGLAREAAPAPEAAAQPTTSVQPAHAPLLAQLQRERIESFFTRYAERFNAALKGEKVSAEDVADSFAEHIVEAGPHGVNGGKNGLLFRWMIPRGFAHYRKLGTQRMEIAKLEIEQLDPQHALAKVHWDSHYRKTDGADEQIEFDVTYLLHLRHGQPKIFAYITGDEERLLRQHGLS